MEGAARRNVDDDEVCLDGEAFALGSATFRVTGWDATTTIPYRLVYLDRLNNGKEEVCT